MSSLFDDQLSDHNNSRPSLPNARRRSFRQLKGHRPSQQDVAPSQLKQQQLTSFFRQKPERQSTPPAITLPTTRSKNLAIGSSHSANALSRSHSQSPPPPPPPPPPQDPNQILKGVVACLDIRTEDGDDVSQNFEHALHSMGAKTRKTIADSVTHLVFKNGSPATLRKALGKKIHVVNLLWITRCKREGRRFDESNFAIEGPQGLMMASKRRRKSMDPGKVEALTPESSAGPDVKPRPKRQRASSIGPRFPDRPPRHSMPARSTSAAARRKMRETFHVQEKTHINGTPASDHDDLENRQILREDVAPGNDSAFVDLTDDPNTKGSPRDAHPHASKTAAIDPETVERANKIRQRIKADFFVGNTEPATKLARLAPSEKQPLLRRKRRSVGPSAHGLDSSSGAAVTAPSSSASSPPPPPAVTKQKNIVMTSLPDAKRKQITDIIGRLGRCTVSSSVDETTTHVIVGGNRRTDSVVRGLLNGAYLVKAAWIFDSDDAGDFISEDAYLATDWFPRLEAALARVPLLPSNLHVFLGPTLLPAASIQYLVTKAGGKLVDSLDQADIVISKKRVRTDKMVVGENWLLTSIQEWRYVSTEPYLIDKKQQQPR
ncbi:hypothetical protein BCR43DRAFT_487021 [Syncephalastrum racemosum]|uniref:BRCT domain-containing protein n=1 Tax=Syncephalastrum racemosum TaxID=13706 RepID=A0A1X2HQ20_SYNRA|nr:hypothetical protein BCR43DRAFT_487021 [Syncephalastrum racemosum]